MMYSITILITDHIIGDTVIKITTDLFKLVLFDSSNLSIYVLLVDANYYFFNLEIYVVNLSDFDLHLFNLDIFKYHFTY